MNPWVASVVTCKFGVFDPVILSLEVTSLSSHVDGLEPPPRANYRERLVL